MTLQFQEDNKLRSVEVEGETIEDALNQASVELSLPIKELEYEVLQKGDRGFLGVGRKDWILRVYEVSQKVEITGTGVEDLVGDLGERLDENTVADRDGEVFVRLTQEGVFLKVTQKA